MHRVEIYGVSTPLETIELASKLANMRGTICVGQYAWDSFHRRGSRITNAGGLFLEGLFLGCLSFMLFCSHVDDVTVTTPGSTRA